MIYESRSEDNITNCIVTGLAMNSPYFEESDFSGKRRQYAKFYLQYQYKRGLGGEKAFQTIPCIVFRRVLLDLCKSIKKNDSLIVIGVKNFDKVTADRTGKQAYSVQVSDIFQMSLYYECMSYFRELMRYDKNLVDVYKKENRINHKSVNYSGEPDRPYDAEF